MIKISIITICKNAQNVIEKTLESVFMQTYPHIEYIVIDGASTDNTRAVIERYRDKISQIVSEPDHGIYDAMNKGIAHATGDVLQFLNAGDALHDPSVIANIVTAFDKNPASDIIYGKPVFENIPEDMKQHALEYQTGPKTMMDWMLTPACHQAIFIKRSVFDKIGLYKTTYRLSGDVEFFLRCFSRKIPMHYIDRNIVFYHYQGASLANVSISNRERLKAIRTHATPYQLFRYTIKVLKRRIKRLARQQQRGGGT